MNIQVQMPPKPELKWASDYPAVPQKSKDEVISELQSRVHHIGTMLQIVLNYAMHNNTQKGTI